MSKDRIERMHPPKGKPSGVNKEEGLGIQGIPPEKMDEYLELTDRYTLDADELSPDVHLRHPNRNTSKKHETVYKGKDNTPDSDRTVKENIGETPEMNVVPEELPGQVSKEIFTELANFQSPLAISVYIPTHRSGMQVNEHNDLITFKNAIQQVSNTLQERGMDQQAISRLLEPAFLLVKDLEFWVNLTEGLGVFISEGYFKFLKMPLTPEHRIHINSSFYVAPLVPLMGSKEYFYLLTISKKQAKLFRVDDFTIQYIPVPGLPSPVDEIVQFEEKEEQGTEELEIQKGTNYLGTGTGRSGGKTQIALYFEEIDDVIWKTILHDESVPLVLAGVEYLIPIYKSVTDYKFIADEALTGSHEYDDSQTLFKISRELMQPYFDKRLTRALETYGNQSATALTSSSINDIIPSAYYGRVSHLFVRKGEQIWGTFDEMNNELKINEADAGGEDLVDKAITKTIVNGGEVFQLSKEQMPAEHVLAAIFRY